MLWKKNCLILRLWNLRLILSSINFLFTSSRRERGHAGHVPGWTSSITDGGDEEKNKKLCDNEEFHNKYRV